MVRRLVAGFGSECFDLFGEAGDELRIVFQQIEDGGLVWPAQFPTREFAQFSLYFWCGFRQFPPFHLSLETIQKAGQHLKCVFHN